MPILVFFLIFLIGCSDCSQKSNSPQNNDPNPKHGIPEIPLVLPEEPTPTPDEPTTPPDKPKPPTPNENDKQKYEWIDITFEDDTSYDDKIKGITPICSFLIKDGVDNKHTLSKVIIKSGHNEVILSSDLYTDRGFADRRKLMSKKIPPEYMGGSCLQIRFLRSEIKFVKNMSALFYLGKKVVS